MFFKNICVLRLSEIINFDILEEKLKNKPFVGCEPFQAISCGWTKPLGKQGESFIHPVQNNKAMICLRTEEKILPSSVINDALNEKCDEIYEREGKWPAGKLKQALKDDVIAVLLPKAFSKYTNLYAYIDNSKNIIAVDTGSVNKAEDLIAVLRSVFEGFPVKRIRTKMPIGLLMTDWVHKSNPPPFVKIEHECELIDYVDDGAVVSTKKQDLSAGEIINHIDVGKVVSKLRINWDDKFSVLLVDDFTMKRLKFSDEVLDSRLDYEDRTAQFSADFVLMVNEIGTMFDKLIILLGGEANE